MDSNTIQVTNEQRIYFMGRALWSLTLRGDPTERDKGLHERMSHPKPGDLVIETSTAYQVRTDPQHAAQAVGWLDSMEGNHPIFRYHVAPYAGGPVLSWDNAEFVAIPNGMTINDFIGEGVT